MNTVIFSCIYIVKFHLFFRPDPGHCVIFPVSKTRICARRSTISIRMKIIENNAAKEHYRGHFEFICRYDNICLHFFSAYFNSVIIFIKMLIIGGGSNFINSIITDVHTKQNTTFDGPDE